MKLRYNSAENRSRFASWRQDRANLAGQGRQAIEPSIMVVHHGLHNLLRQGIHVTSVSTKMICLCSKSNTTFTVHPIQGPVWCDGSGDGQGPRQLTWRDQTTPPAQRRCSRCWDRCTSDNHQQMKECDKICGYMWAQE